MNTAQIAIENVVAGALALLAFGLLFVEPSAIAQIPESTLLLTALVGAAYLFGVVFDKAFDRVLDQADAWVRLELACEIPERRKRAKDDRLKQDAWEAELRQKHDGVIEWMGYLRTRIRVTRALAVTAPLIGASVALLLNGPERWARFMPLSAFLLAYAVSELPPEVPKTYQYTEAAPPSGSLKWWAVRWRGTVILYVASSVFALAYTGLDQDAVAAVILGMLVGIVAVLAWQSVTKTYIRYIAVSGSVLDKQGKGP